MHTINFNNYMKQLLLPLLLLLPSPGVLMGDVAVSYNDYKYMKQLSTPYVTTWIFLGIVRQQEVCLFVLSIKIEHFALRIFSLILLTFLYKKHILAVGIDICQAWTQTSHAHTHTHTPTPSLINTHSLTPSHTMHKGL